MVALIEEIRLEAALAMDSPYPEVRYEFNSSTLESASSRAHGFLSSAVVSNTDDPTLPCNTFRVWVIGIFFTIIGTGINQVGGSTLPTCSEVSDQFPTVL